MSGQSWAALPDFEAPTASQMRAHYVDVGQGSAVILEFACGTALIDTGGEKNDGFDSVARLRAYLDQYFNRRRDRNRTIDLLIITHAHIDHTRGLPMVMDAYKIRTLVDNGLERGSGGRQQKMAHTRARALNSGIDWIAVREAEITDMQGLTSEELDPISCTGTDPQFRMLWGALSASDDWAKKTFNNGNDSSVVTRLDFGEASFLFPGDLEEDVHGSLVSFFAEDCSPRCMLDVDVYHVAHHGSHNGTNAQFVDVMTPGYAVISMGPWNRREPWTAQAYGHPRQTVIDALQLGTSAVSGERVPSKDVMIANRSATKRRNTSEEHAVRSQFSRKTMSKAIYATGWDGTVVLQADANGTIRVFTER
jgi:beta-lactamase superfamily II metal-dependent hydrolase